MWHSHFGHSYGYHWIWLITILIVAGIAFFFYRMDKDLPEERSKESALEILKKRFAKGEITAQEFEEMRKKLE